MTDCRTCDHPAIQHDDPRHGGTCLVTGCMCLEYREKKARPAPDVQAQDDPQNIHEGDGTERLCRALYGRKATPRDYLGGADAKMLHDAADRLTNVQAQDDAKQPDPWWTMDDAAKGRAARQVGESEDNWQARVLDAAKSD